MFKIETGVKLSKSKTGVPGRSEMSKTIAALKANQSFFVPIPASKSKKRVYGEVSSKAHYLKKTGVIDFKVKLRAERNDEGKDGIRVFHEKQRA